jgi:GUN4-like
MNDIDKPDKKISFWSTLPGIIAGITALIVAVTGLITALNEVGILKLFPILGTSPKPEASKYDYLKNNLRNKNWEVADSQTMRSLLDEVNKIIPNRDPAQLWFDPIDISVLPCSDLKDIDQLWANASDNRFGFVAQSKVWKSVGGTTATKPDNATRRKSFSTKVGWYGADIVPLSLERLFQTMADKPIPQIPKGYLPSAIGQWKDNKILTGNQNEFASLTSKLNQCGI